MATVIWKGDAAPVAQQTVCTVGGTIEADQNFHPHGGQQGALNVVAVATTAAGVAARVVSAWNALSPTTFPEFSGIVASDNLDGSFTLTGQPGIPFAVTLETTEGDGSPSGSETFTQSTPTAAHRTGLLVERRELVHRRVPANGDDVVIGKLVGQRPVRPRSIGSGAGQFVDRSELHRHDRLAAHAIRPGTSSIVETYLQIRPTTCTSAADRAGSGRIKLDTGPGQCAIHVHNSGNPAEAGLKSILWKGTHASQHGHDQQRQFRRGRVRRRGGDYRHAERGLAHQRHRRLRRSARGRLHAHERHEDRRQAWKSTPASPSLTQSAGETVINAGTPGTMTISGGVVFVTRRTARYTQATLASGGELDFRQDLRTRTGANTTLRAGRCCATPPRPSRSPIRSRWTASFPT